MGLLNGHSSRGAHHSSGALLEIHVFVLDATIG